MSLFMSLYKGSQNRNSLNLVGGVSPTDNNVMFRFHTFWKSKQVEKVFIVGRRDGRPGCFSLMSLREGYDAAWYEDKTPKDLLQSLKQGDRLGEADCYFETNVINKYVGLDLIQFMEKNGIVWR